MNAMSIRFRAVTVVFSALVHGLVPAAGFFFTNGDRPLGEKVYNVSLAEFTPAGAASSVASAVGEVAVSQDQTIPEQEQVTLESSSSPEPEPEPLPVPEASKAKPLLKSRPKPQAKKPRPEPEQRKLQQYSQPLGQSGSGQPTASQASLEANRGGGPNSIGGMRAYTEDAVDQRPSISRRIMPEYPDKARRRNIQGEAIVRVIVDTDGKPRQCVVQSSSPKGIFDDVALAAAKKTRFVPGKIGGQPVNTVVMIPYRFALR